MRENFLVWSFFINNLGIIIPIVVVGCLLIAFIAFIFINRAIKNKNSAKNKNQEIEDSKEKTVGKYIISLPNENDKYHFLLKASNGQVIFKSRYYSSKATCKEGINSFMSAVREGDFTVEQDKSGRFNFRLQKGSQIYEGETVSRKDIAEKTIISIKNNFETDNIVDEKFIKKEENTDIKNDEN